jgi:hypothetical protein
MVFCCYDINYLGEKDTMNDKPDDVKQKKIIIVKSGRNTKEKEKIAWGGRFHKRKPKYKDPFEGGAYR